MTNAASAAGAFAGVAGVPFGRRGRVVSLADLEKTPGLNAATARLVHDFFHEVGASGRKRRSDADTAGANPTASS